MTTVATLWVDLKGNISDFLGKMDTAGGRVNAASAQMSAAGGTMTRNVTTPLFGIGAASTAMAIDLNSGMANVASLSSEAAASIAGWKPQIQETAIAVGKGTGDMADGMYNVISAFGVADDSMQVLDINARAAAAGLSTTTDAINLTSAVTKGYGDTSAVAVQHAADLALRTVQLGQTTFPELASSVGRVVPIMASLGGTQQELFAVLATGTGVTGTASEVSTQLRGVLQSLMAPTADMAALMGDLGYENGQAMMQGLGLQGSIAAIMGAAEATGLPLQKYIGSIEGQTLAMALHGPQADVFTEKMAAMGNVAGATQSAFEAQTEGINAIGFEAQQSRIQMQVWGQQIGDQLLPVIAELLPSLKPVVDTVGNLIQRFADADPRTQKMIIGLGGVAAAAGPVLMMVGAVGSGIGTLMTVSAAAGPVLAGLTSSTGALGVAMTVLTGPVGIAIAALVAGGAALHAAWRNDFGGVRTFIQAKLGEVDGDFRALWPALNEWATSTDWGQLGETMITGLLDKAAELWTRTDEWLTGYQAQFWEWFANVDWGQLGYNVVTSILQFLTDMARWEQNIRTWLGGLFTGFIQWVAEIDWGAIAQRIIEGMVQRIQSSSAVRDALLAMARGAWEAIRDFFEMQSPSRKAFREAGWITAGLALGIDDGRGAVVAAVGRVNRAVEFNRPKIRPNLQIDELADFRPNLPALDVRAGVRPNGSSGANRPISLNFGDIIIYATGAARAKEIGAEFERRLRSKALEGLVMANV